MNGILLLGQDGIIESRARSAGLAVDFGESPALPFERTLITVPGTRLPFELLPAGFGLLERWDAAVPLWQYTVTAESVGAPEERERTRLVIRDLRVLLHATELLFVRRNEAGQALVDAWTHECAGGGNERLAFLRAFYTVKPRLCVLPTSWLASGPRAKPGMSAGRGVRTDGLVVLELEPGRLVKVHPGDEERVRAHFARQRGRR